MFLVCAVIAVLVGTVHSQCTRLPTENEIQIAVQSNVYSNFNTGDNGTVEVLLTQHFTCIAPDKRLGEIQQVSIAVIFDFTTDMGINITRRQHIHLRCSGVNNWRTLLVVEENPPAVAFNLTTREDCFLCLSGGPVIHGFDTDANCARESLSDLILCTCTYSHLVLLCAVCPSRCSELEGQNRCYNPADPSFAREGVCCPVYENGTCAEMCSTNRTASAATNFTCGKQQWSYKIHEVHCTCTSMYDFV